MKTKKDKTKKSLELPVCDTKGKKVDEISLSDKTFDGEVNIPLLHQVVNMYRANLRSGSASTKGRAEVRGGGKKPWRQKGTGRARTGSIRNPLWRGGGIIFGPHARDFSYSLPRKIKKKAIKSSLNEKFLGDSLIIINEIRLDTHKTKEVSSILESLGIKEGQRAIIILEKLDDNIKLASRNIPNLCLRSANNFNALDILRYNKLIIQQSVLTGLMKVLQ